MAEVKWIKIVTDIFDDESIKIIEEMPEGDTIIVIWFKLLIQSGKINDGGLIYFKKDIPFTEEMLATVFKRPLNIIRLALKIFGQFGMIQIYDTQEIFIMNWEKHQNTSGMEQIKEYNRLAKQKQREKAKELMKLQCQGQSQGQVKESHETDIDIDIDIDKKDIYTVQQKELAEKVYLKYSSVLRNGTKKKAVDNILKIIKFKNFLYDDFKIILTNYYDEVSNLQDKDPEKIKKFSKGVDVFFNFKNEIWMQYYKEEP